jgi:hypothetical protein
VSAPWTVLTPLPHTSYPVICSFELTLGFFQVTLGEGDSIIVSASPSAGSYKIRRYKECIKIWIIIIKTID